MIGAARVGNGSPDARGREAISRPQLAFHRKSDRRSAGRQFRRAPRQSAGESRRLVGERDDDPFEVPSGRCIEARVGAILTAERDRLQVPSRRCEDSAQRVTPRKHAFDRERFRRCPQRRAARHTEGGIAVGRLGPHGGPARDVRRRAGVTFPDEAAAQRYALAHRQAHTCYVAAIDGDGRAPPVGRCA